MQYAALYKSGIDGIFFNKKIFWGWVSNAFYHGTVVFIFGCWSLDSAAPDGGVLGMYVKYSLYIQCGEIFTLRNENLHTGT